MPVTLQVTDRSATEWDSPAVLSIEDHLKSSCPRQSRRSKKIIQSSFGSMNGNERHVSASRHGFIWAVWYAYSNHHHLKLRPDDIWHAILVQLGFYINANAEELRSFFVEHQGQKDLEVFSFGGASSFDFDGFAAMMSREIAKNVKDSELQTWVMPSFSTTTQTDRTVATVLFMGAMQKYFSYRVTLLCGIPSVTLLGEVEDWEQILATLDKLETLGKEARIFGELLKPILRHMVLSFHEPNSPKVVNFWNTVTHRVEGGSGVDYIEGWLTAFCYWGEDGKAKPMNSDTWSRRPCYQLENTFYPVVDTGEFPMGTASVPLTIDDNGHEINSMLVAGSVGIEAVIGSHESQSGADVSDVNSESTPVQRNTIQPVSGWWLVEAEDEKEAQERAAELKKIKQEMKQYWSASREDQLGIDLGALFRRCDELEAF